MHLLEYTAALMKTLDGFDLLIIDNKKSEKTWTTIPCSNGA
jgi:hypothetical protein